MTATQALNQIAKLTGSTDKNEVITLAIGTLIKNGVDTKTSFDAILGKGAYLKMAGMIYDELNRK